MHRNPNNQPPDERNPETLPITIESYQKEHLFNTKKRTAEEEPPQSTEAPPTQTGGHSAPKRRNKPQNQPKQDPAEGRGSNPHPWLPLESNNGRAKASDVSPGTGNY